MLAIILIVDHRWLVCPQLLLLLLWALWLVNKYEAAHLGRLLLIRNLLIGHYESKMGLLTHCWNWTGDFRLGV